MKHPIQQTRHTNHPNTITKNGDEILENQSEHGKFAHIPGASTEELHRRLILTLEGKIIREYPITDNPLSIGRRHGNDIQLNDLTLSGRHALISCIPDYVFIEDLGSTNGTLVNGCHIKKVALEHGDIIQIGHHQLTYLCDNVTPYIPTMFIKAEHDETQFIYSDGLDMAGIIKGHSLGGLRTINNNQSQPVPVMELRKTFSTIGFRGKRMALITRGTDYYSISGITGTHTRRLSDMPLLNGEQLDNGQKLLNPGDIITIAGYEVQFYILD